MRTTVTLDTDIARKVKNIAYLRKISFKAALNETLRRGLMNQDNPDDDPEPFVVEPHESLFRPGIDLTKLSQLADAEKAAAVNTNDEASFQLALKDLAMTLEGESLEMTEAIENWNAGTQSLEAELDLLEMEASES